MCSAAGVNRQFFSIRPRLGRLSASDCALTAVPLANRSASRPLLSLHFNSIRANFPPLSTPSIFSHSICPRSSLLPMPPVQSGDGVSTGKKKKKELLPVAASNRNPFREYTESVNRSSQGQSGTVRDKQSEAVQHFKNKRVREREREMYWNINLKGETCQHCDQDKSIGRFGCKLIFTLSALFGQSCSCKMSASLSVTCPDAASFRIGRGALFSEARFSSSTSRQFCSYRLQVCTH